MFRNFGIVAHVDAGKTTLAERILHVCGRIHTPGEVKGARPTQLDHRKVEIERGITVTAAATTVSWRGRELSIVDTPGHIDFSVEVERALRVLDGAVLVVDAVAGAQTQTRSVERQMARYGVPRIAVVNKCDHPAADPDKAVESMRARLSVNASLVSLPYGRGAELQGVIDLVEQRVVIVEEGGLEVSHHEIPAALRESVAAARERLVDAVSLVDAELTEQTLAGGSPSAEALSAAIRRATLSRSFVPVLVAAAACGIGIQAVLDAICAWLPGPEERVTVATDASSGAEIVLSQDGPAVAYVFKTEETEHGIWTWLRVYRGRIEPGMSLVDGRSASKHKLGRLGRLNGGKVERISSASAGEIVACFGLDLPSGTTLCDPSCPVFIGALHIGEPVVEQAVSLLSGEEEDLSKGLARLVRDDPSLRLRVDTETGETLLAGMGELHLEVAVDMLQEQHRVKIALGKPEVAIRYALRQPSRFDFLHKKQTGGPGQYARLRGEIRPSEGFSFSWAVVGGEVASSYKSVVERALREESASGAGLDWPLFGIDVVITGGEMHSTDSSERAFDACARGLLREAVERAGAVRMEPVVRVVAEAISARPGTLASLLLSREGRLLDATVDGNVAKVEAIVPLSRMFGFAEVLRSATSGDGTFSMEPSGYLAREA